MFLTALSLVFAPEPLLDRYAACAVEANGEIYFVGGSSGREHRLIDQLDIYDPRSGRWRRGPSCPEPRDFGAITATPRILAISGGLSSKGLPVTSLNVYDLAKRAWRKGPAMPVAVSRAAADVLGFDSVVTGGIESAGGRSVNSRAVQSYSHRFNNWRRGPDLPIVVHGHTATTVGKTLYVVGGYAGEGMLPSSAVWSLNVDGKVWRERAAMPETRTFHSAVAYGGRLFVFGNRGDSETPLVYDPRIDKWAKVAVEDLHRHRAGFAMAGSKAYFLGGEGNGALLKVFDLNKTLWLK